MTYIINYTNSFTSFVYNNTHNSKLQFYAFAVAWALMTPYVGGALHELVGLNSWEFTEELMKCLSCGLGATFALVSTFAFAVGEMFEYMMKPEVQPLYDYGWYWNFFLYRLTCIMDHMIYVSIHLIGHKIASYKPSAWSRFRIRAIAFSIAYAIHMIHNNGWGLWVARNVFNMQ